MLCSNTGPDHSAVDVGSSEAESVSDPRVADRWMVIFGGEAGAEGHSVVWSSGSPLWE